MSITLEAGIQSGLTLEEDTIHKISPIVGAYQTLDQAEKAGEELATYATVLIQQPVRTTDLRGAVALPVEGGYKLRHSYRLIDGPSLAEVTRQGSLDMLALAVGEIAAMDTISKDRLVVPIDAKVENFHVDTEGPVLVDMFPAMAWNPNGSLRMNLAHQKIDRSKYTSWSSGTKSGALTTLLSTSIDRGETTASKLASLTRNIDDRMYDILPLDLDSHVRAAIRKQIRGHFISHAARLGLYKAASKL